MRFYTFINSFNYLATGRKQIGYQHPAFPIFAEFRDKKNRLEMRL